MQAAAGSPDLIPQSIGVSPNPVSPNGAITVSWTIRNQGNATASASTTAVRVEASNSCAPGAQAQIATAALAAGGSVGQSTSMTAPASGTYYICVIADNFSTSGQTGTTPNNDIQIAGPFTVQTTGPALSIITTSLPSATVGIVYAQGVAASGGQSPYTWSVSSGLPAGLNINSTSGAISGTPSTSGAFDFTVTVTDSGSPQKTTSRALSIIVGNTVATTPMATLVSETIPVGTSITGGQSFTKTWTILNSGTTTWDSTTKLKWVTGANLSNHNDLAVSGTVAPGSSFTFSVVMIAPTSAGSYREDWNLVGGSGAIIPVSGSNTVWVSIVVGNNAALGGTVLDANTLQPLSGAAVLVGASGPYTTSGNGLYQANGLASGTYTLSVSNAGYDTWSNSITLSPNQSARKDVLLTRKPIVVASVPRITSLTSKYSKSSGSKYYFLPGVSFNVTYAAQVDWNGATPGKVRFITSQGNRDVATSGATASATFDVGAAFSSCTTLSAIAIPADGSQSEAKTADFVVTKPLPIDPAIPVLVNNLSVVDSNSSSGASFKYINNSTLNKDLIDTTIGQYGSIPILNKAASGLKYVPEFDFEFDGQDGKATYTLSLYKNNAFNALCEQYYSRRNNPNGLKNLLSGITDLVNNGTVDRRHIPTATIAGFEAFLFPVAEMESTFNAASCGSSSNNWDSVGSGGLAGSAEWSVVYQSLLPPPLPPFPWYLKGALGLEFDAILSIIDLSDLKFAGDFTANPYISATLGAGINDAVAVEGTGTGGVDAAWHLPPPSLTKCDAYLSVTGRVYILGWEQAFPTKRWEENCVGTAAGTSAVQEIRSAALSGSTTSLISRNYLAAAKSGVFQTVPRYQLKQFVSAGSTYSVASSPIVSATFPVSAANLSSAGGHVSLLWLTDNPARSAINRTMAVYSSFDGTTWSAPVPIADNGTADFNPFAITLLDGSVVAAWEDVKTVLPDAASLDAIASQLEISVAVYDPVAHAWGSPVQVTNNATLDRTPRLAGKTKTNLMLTWIGNAWNNIVGSAAQPNTLFYARYDGTSWSAPAVAASIPNQIKRYNLVYDGTTANVVLAVDTDNDPSTLEDLELYRLTYAGGAWSAPIRLTNDAIIDDNPQLALDSSNNVVMTWLKGSELSSVVNFDFTKRTIIRSDQVYSSSLADFKQATTGDGKVAVIYVDRSATHTADLFGVFYDPVFKLWGSPKQLTDDPDTEQWPSIAFLGTDTIVSIYNRKLLINSDGTPTTGALTDLYMLKHSMGDDLGLETGSLKIDPNNSAPGALVNLSVNALNLGDKPAQNVAVTFYNGNPANGGIEIGTVTIGGPFLPGDSQSVTLPWTIPAGIAPPTVCAVIDPASSIDTLNRGNNTVCTAVALPDLVVQSITREMLGSNRSSLVISVANIGGTTSGATQVELHFGSDTGPVVATLDVPALARFGSVDLTFDWDTSAIAESSVTLVAIVNEMNIVQESNVLNNRYAVTFAPSAPTLQAVVEYLNTANFPNSPGGHFFYSSDAAEQAAVDAGSAGAFFRTGRAFRTGGISPVCRFYGSMTPGPNSHFFTVDIDECNALKTAQVTPTPATVQQWNYEGLSYSTTPTSVAVNGVRSCPPNTQPLYRVYNNAYPVSGPKNPWDSNHRFTPLLSDIAEMVSSGWRDEGIVFCTPK